MRATDIFTQIKQLVRDFTRWTQHPIENIMWVLKRWGQRTFESLTFNNLKFKKQFPFVSIDNKRSPDRETHVEREESFSSQLSVNRANYNRPIEETSTIENQAIEREIQGRKGLYKFSEADIISSSENSTLYRAESQTNFGDWEPVEIQIIKIKNNTLISKNKNSNEIYNYLESLVRSSLDALKFRVIFPTEFCKLKPDSDEVYLVFPADQNLGCNKIDRISDLAKSPRLVHSFLSDILQGLEYLHEKVEIVPERLGIAHGNLNLDSFTSDNNQKFYLQNLELFKFKSNWKKLTEDKTKQADLVKLGDLVSQAIDDRTYKVDDSLNSFLQNLKQGKFKTAKDVRKELSNIEITRNRFQVIEKRNSEQKEEFKKQSKSSNLSLLLLKIISILFLLKLIHMGVSRLWLETKPIVSQFSSLNQSESCNSSENCTIASVFTQLTDRTIVYTADEPWIAMWKSDDIDTVEDKLKLDRTFRDRGMKLDLISEPRLNFSQFWISQSVNKTDRDSKFAGWNPETIAYDGLVVFVSKNEIKDDLKLVELLKGKISLEVLRKIYNGSITNWNQVPSLETVDRPISVYLPQDEGNRELGTLVKTIVYQNSNEKLRSDIIQNLDVMKTIGRIANEDPVGIGLARIGDIFEQCSVYPLAIEQDNQIVQPFIEDTQNPINLTTDLCGDKGSYFPNPKLFESGEYPLSYQWVVASRQNDKPDGVEEFIQMLKTEEGQTLLQESGLIPLSKSAKITEK